ncbi:hypothetical protein ACQRIU_005929 [Beauveria bassiana]
MDELIAALVARNIEELFEQCGIKDPGQEQANATIRSLTASICDIRLQAGIDSVIPCPDEQVPATKFRGSYRLLQTDLKRGAANYAGLYKAPRKKRKTKKRELDILTARNADHNLLTPESSDAPDDSPTCAPGPNGQLSGDQAAAAIDPADGLTPKKVPDSVHAPSGTGDSVASDASDQVGANTTVGESSHNVGNIEYSPPPLVLPRLPAAEAKVMESILVDCEKLNRKLHQVSMSKEQTSSWTANTLEIQGYVADIAQRDFTEAVRHINTGNAALAGRDIQSRYSQAYFWDIITKLANEMDPTKVKNARGPLTDFTEPERQATREFLRSTGADNLTYNRLSEYRQRWRRLSNMRRAGVDKILCYHTKQYNTFCKHYEGDDLQSKVLSWEHLYEWFITHLELRVATSCGGDKTGRLWLKHPFVAERLSIPEDLWNSSVNMWGSASEKAQYELAHEHTRLSDAQLGGPSAKHSDDRDKSMFVTLLPRDQCSLYVCPIVPVYKGDVLGAFSGKVRYSESFDVARGIPGPVDRLWLHYRGITGAMNLMDVAAPGGDANVRLAWQGQYHLEKGKWSCSWKVFVHATKVVKPFEGLIRAAPDLEQYRLHQSAEQARRAFMAMSAVEMHGGNT